jgi:hypothetical protein
MLLVNWVEHRWTPQSLDADILTSLASEASAS